MKKEVFISEELRLAIQKHAEDEYPTECCGILFGKVEADNRLQVLAYEQMKNESLSGGKNRHFCINPLRLYAKEEKYREEGLEIIGFVHSHPDAPTDLSKEDIVGMIPEQLYMILSVRNKSCTDIKIWEKGNNDEERGCLIRWK